MAVSARPVVVGIDGSEQSFQAALWAATEATHRGAPLQLILVNDDPARADYSEKVVREAAARCRNQAPQLAATEAVVPGHVIEEMINRSSSADLIVVGSRGLGRFARALLGSVSAAVATHSACPVVVVRGHGVTGGPVVVGVDGSPGSRAALRFAVDTADERKTDVVAVTAWPTLTTEYPVDVPLLADEEQIERQLERVLAEQLADCRKRHPDVVVRSVVRRGHPVAVLTDVARDAALLAVGHRGRGGFAGLLLGSVAAGVLHHAPGPVAVVHA